MPGDLTFNSMRRGDDAYGSLEGIVVGNEVRLEMRSITDCNVGWRNVKVEVAVSSIARRSRCPARLPRGWEHVHIENR